VNNRQVTMNDDVSFEKGLHPSEEKLIKAVRSINFGEIDSIKIQNGLPVMFKVTLGEQDLYEEKVLGDHPKL